MSESRREQALEIVARAARQPVSAIRPEQELAGFDMSSADALELLADLEDAFDVEISEVEAAKFKTVGDVLAAVERA